jgi:hypothetical protein
MPASLRIDRVKLHSESNEDTTPAVQQTDK